MKIKNLFLIIICSVLGFSSGFFITKKYVSPAQNTISYISPSEEVALAIGSEQVQATPQEIPKDETIVSTQTKTVEVKKPVKQDCLQPKKEYEDYTYLDVGQKVAIPDKTYVPSDLTLIDKTITTVPICLKKDAADAITSLISAANKDGYKIKISSGFRSYETQKIILANSIKNGNKNASIAIAKPGYSEHQLGVAVDLTGLSVKNASATIKFQDTDEDTWLEEHAYEYGFIQSYPEDKLATTGYMYEAWHYRFVGIDNAKEIIKNNQTINEFLKLKNESLNKNSTQ